MFPFVGDIRGMGAMLGLEFVKDKNTKEPATDLVTNLILACVKKGLLIENAGGYGNVIRFLAPLVITDEQLEMGFQIMEECMKEI